MNTAARATAGRYFLVWQPVRLFTGEGAVWNSRPSRRIRADEHAVVKHRGEYSAPRSTDASTCLRFVARRDGCSPKCLLLAIGVTRRQLRLWRLSRGRVYGGIWRVSMLFF
jgi:hypothetical protein